MGIVSIDVLRMYTGDHEPSAEARTLTRGQFTMLRRMVAQFAHDHGETHATRIDESGHCHACDHVRAHADVPHTAYVFACNCAICREYRACVCDELTAGDSIPIDTIRSLRDHVRDWPV